MTMKCDLYQIRISHCKLLLLDDINYDSLVMQPVLDDILVPFHLLIQVNKQLFSHISISKSY